MFNSFLAIHHAIGIMKWTKEFTDNSEITASGSILLLSCIAEFYFCPAYLNERGMVLLTSGCYSKPLAPTEGMKVIKLLIAVMWL